MADGTTPDLPCASRAGDTHRARWQRLCSWPQDDPLLQRRFLQQLRAATGWSAGEATQAIEEYRRFCCIAAEREGRVAPSPAIDAVWHLHLTYTRDYWLDFCPRRLRFALHHQPALGRPGEALRLRDDYADTLHAYAARFGLPAERWWPATARTPSPAGWRTRLARLCGLALLLPTPALASPLAGTPLDWRGPEFLALYLVLAAVALVGGLACRALLLRQLPEGSQRGATATWEIAFLAGGAERVVDSAVAELHRLGAIAWDERQRRFVRGSAAPPQDAVLAAVHGHLLERAPDVGRAARTSALAALRSALQRRGWWCDPAQAQRIALFSALPLASVSVFGLAKVAVGILRDRPVALLVLLCALTVVAAIVFAFNRPGITPAGKRALQQAREGNALALRAHRPEQVALAVALGGTAVLAGTALAAYHDFRQPPASSDSGTSSSSDSSSSDGGSSDGGSGCGGCGGGGD